MKKTAWLWLLPIGIAVALTAALALLPARLIETLLRDRATGVTMQGAAGTLWRGEAVLIVPLRGARSLELPVRWSWAPGGLPALAWDVEIQGAVQGRMRAAAGWRGVTLSTVDLAATMDVAARFDRRLALLRPGGRAMLRTGGDGVRIGYAAPLSLHGNARLAVDDFRLRSLMAPAFGSYEAALTAQGSRIDYAIERAGGLLRLDGGGYVSLDGGAGTRREVVYRGNAAPGREAPPWLIGALLLAGRPMPDGRIAIDYRTQW